jgi:hypothetical protein
MIYRYLLRREVRRGSAVVVRRHSDPIGLGLRPDPTLPVVLFSDWTMSQRQRSA